MAVVDALGDAGPLLGVGHSMGGAVLVMTELARPGTFRALALYEPIVFPPGRGDDVGSSPIVEGARRRRAEFASREAARANFAAKPPLDVLDPEVLDLYVAQGFADTPDGTVRLKCEPATEALHVRGQHRPRHPWRAWARSRCPVLVMAATARGGHAGRVRRGRRRRASPTASTTASTTSATSDRSRTRARWPP